MSFGKDIDKATQQLASLDRVIQASLPRTAKAGAGELKAEAVRRTPVRTGKLKNNFQDRAATAGERTAVNSASHLVFNTTFYANAVQYGRKNGHPFYRMAAKTAQPAVKSAMETAVKRETDKVL